MLNWLTKADKGADLAVRWVTVYTLVTGGYAVLGRQVPWLANLNWAELLLLGILASLVTVFVIAASLALFRYFRPLGDTAAPAVAVGHDDDLEQRLARLEHNHGNLRDRFVEAQANSASREMVDDLQRKLDEHIAAVAGPLGELEAIRQKRRWLLEIVTRYEAEEEAKQVAELRGFIEKGRNAFGMKAAGDIWPIIMERFSKLGISTALLSEQFAQKRQEIIGDARFLMLDEGEKERWSAPEEKRRWHIHRAMYDVYEAALNDLKRYQKASRQRSEGQ